MLMLALLLSLPPQAPTPPQAPPVQIAQECGCSYGGLCICGNNCVCVRPLESKFPTYAAAKQQAEREGKPAIVFVGMSPRSIPGCVSTRYDDLGVGYPAYGVVIFTKSKEFGFMAWVKSIPWNASDEEILQALRQPGGSAPRLQTQSYYAPVLRATNC